MAVIILVMRPARSRAQNGRDQKDQKDGHPDDDAQDKIPEAGQPDSNETRREHSKSKRSYPVHDE